MFQQSISYQKSGYFSALICDYLNQKEETKKLYHRFPLLENFEAQIAEKQANFNDENRSVLVSLLHKQYQKIDISLITSQNIHLLKNKNTFTITTGHQLNLFTGPLYFLYKIISVIKLTQELKIKYPQHNFVPVYWMATEDHDFEEINFFNFKDKKICWDKKSKGAVGRLSTKGLEKVCVAFSTVLGTSLNANKLKKIFQEAYLQHNNLSDATRYLVNALFGTYGLVILDADSKELKTLFVPFAQNELFKNTGFNEVTKTIAEFKNYNIQVNPREINLFYIEDDLRERIIFEDNLYKIKNTNKSFDKAEILELLYKNPEKISPNVITRPLYQEAVLPNLAYVGGGGEIAYWLELKSFFEASKITFPMLLLRNSAVIISEKQAQKAKKLDLNYKDLFLKQPILINQQTQKATTFSLDLSGLKEQLSKQFIALNKIASQTDTSFLGILKAQEIKQIKGLEKLEKRLLKAQKQKLANVLERIVLLQNSLFPNQSLQERQANFAEFYIEYGDDLITKLFKELKPIEQEFNIVKF